MLQNRHKSKGKGRPTTAGTSAAAKDLGLSRQKIDRAEAIASIAPPAKDAVAPREPRKNSGTNRWGYPALPLPPLP
jgi:hypothetical protein